MRKSAKLGYEVIAKLPNDREGVVYLAYDLYYLGRYDDALALVNEIRANPRQGQGSSADCRQCARAQRRPERRAEGFHACAGTRSENGYRICESRVRVERSPRAGQGRQGFSDCICSCKTTMARRISVWRSLIFSFTVPSRRSSNWMLRRKFSASRTPGIWPAPKDSGKSRTIAHAATEYRAALAETPNDLTTRIGLCRRPLPYASLLLKRSTPSMRR